MTDDAQERRRAARHSLHFMAEIASGADAHIAVTRDASSTGVLLLTRADLEVGQEVSVKIVLPKDPANPRRLTGRVVRKQALSSEEAGLWTEKVALHLIAPDDAMIQELLDSAYEHEARISRPPEPPR